MMLIVFEGPEGAGKTTQARLLTRSLQQLSADVVLVREPGGTALGERVRQILLDPELEIDGVTEYHLYAAARTDLINKTLVPALNRGATVIADRYWPSTVAYQGAGRGLQLPEFAGPEPDLIFILDVDTECGLLRSASADRMERQSLDFHRRVRNSYLEQARQDPSRYVIVPSGMSIEEVHAEVVRTLAVRLDLALAVSQ